MVAITEFRFDSFKRPVFRTKMVVKWKILPNLCEKISGFGKIYSTLLQSSWWSTIQGKHRCNHFICLRSTSNIETITNLKGSWWRTSHKQCQTKKPPGSAAGDLFGMVFCLPYLKLKTVTFYLGDEARSWLTSSQKNVFFFG